MNKSWEWLRTTPQLRTGAAVSWEFHISSILVVPASSQSLFPSQQYEFHWVAVKSWSTTNPGWQLVHCYYRLPIFLPWIHTFPLGWNPHFHSQISAFCALEVTLPLWGWLERQREGCEETWAWSSCCCSSREKKGPKLAQLWGRTLSAILSSCQNNQVSAVLLLSKQWAGKWGKNPQSREGVRVGRSHCPQSSWHSPLTSSEGL